MRQVSCSICNKPCTPKETTIIDHKRVCRTCNRDKKQQEQQFVIK